MAQGLRSIPEAAGILNSGGILLLLTDTLPGFHARADNEEACSRIQKIKGRENNKPMVVLAGSLDQARLVCDDLTREQEQCLSHYWPGPFSFILPARPMVSHWITGGLGTVAVRVPAVEGLRNLVRATGFPLASTSVNFSGEDPCLTLAEAVSQFSSDVPNHWVDDSRDGLIVKSQPSAIINLTVSPARQLRQGPLPFRILR